MAEIDDRGQNLTLRTRRGADLNFTLELTDADTEIAIDITGATVISRITAPALAGFQFGYTIDGPAGLITLQLTAAQTLNMAQDWQFVVAYKLAGVTQPLLYGPLYVSQEQL